ncbi:MAG: helix-turn-helix domain-containing protein [Roseburia sp.]|nr:helix-turn-helix domain-containing protein [Roseburia sp.]MCM1096497.1 helix-turn-helix domain-containing protein [Ruminococcus flavefaciens]
MESKIGTQIAKLRKEQEITQAALAEYLSVSPQAVSRWENGVSIPDICLLPQIAAFFNVSIDMLFGVSDYDKILFLVKKYSSDRNDINYREAMRYLDMELKEDDGNLKLLALKLHMLLQRSREYHAKALALCEALIPMAEGEDEELYTAFTLQRQQFLAEDLKGRQVLEECLERYRSEKTALHLRFYFEALLMTERERELFEFIETDDFAGKLFRQPEKSALALYDQAYQACVARKDAEGAEKYRRLVERFSGEDA